MSRTAAAIAKFCRQAVGATVGVALLASLSLAAVPVLARDNAPALAPVAMAELPAEAQATHRRIAQGGPFPYAKDGSVFGNRERRLPPAPGGGYYREYTVPTPGAADRGARRIVCGGRQSAASDSSFTCFYTADHYASFRRISR